jgi:hypothetical protein
MSREVRRVPLDFDWPTEKVWEGYVRPASLSETDCPDCGGTGYSPTALWLSATFYGYAHREGDTARWCDKISQAEVDILQAAGRLRVWRDGAWHNDKRTAEDVNEMQRNHRGLEGHDAINRGILIDYRCAALGFSDRCSICEGHGSTEAYPGQRAESEAWEPTQPPEGEGWQMWETVSEGSPLSPVFATSEGLVDWMVDVGAWRQKYSREQAEKFVRVGFSLGSFIVRDGQVIDGIDAL